MNEFRNKTVIVTGAAGSLGQATVDYFSKSGATVAQLDIVAITPEPKSPHLTAICDLIDADSCFSTVTDILKRLGKVDVLANIAGGFLMGDLVYQTTDQTWDFLIDLNAKTVLNMARVIVPQMLIQGSGKIVNIGARTGLHGASRMGAYTASKSAVIRLTEAMAEELKNRHINVNCVLPSIIDTPRNRADMPNADFSNWVSPSAIAKVVGFLCSDAATPIHGVALPVSGLS